MSLRDVVGGHRAEDSVSLRYRVGTLLGRPRRENILRHVPKHRVGAEVGVFRGAFARHIVRIAKPTELHLIDGWWTLWGERFPDWGAYTDFGRLATRQAYEEAVRAAPTASIHVGDDLALLGGFADQYFDWVYLDTSHDYNHTVAELALLDRKVKRSGIVLGDDWHDDTGHIHAGVTKAIREFCAAGTWRLVIAGDACGQWLIERGSRGDAPHRATLSSSPPAPRRGGLQPPGSLP